jgi:hypothetical protein
MSSGDHLPCDPQAHLPIADDRSGGQIHLGRDQPDQPDRMVVRVDAGGQPFGIVGPGMPIRSHAAPARRDRRFTIPYIWHSQRDDYRHEDVHARAADSAAIFNGITRTQHVTSEGDTLVTMLVKARSADITPTN